MLARWSPEVRSFSAMGASRQYMHPIQRVQIFLESMILESSPETLTMQRRAEPSLGRISRPCVTNPKLLLSDLARRKHLVSERRRFCLKCNSRKVREPTKEFARPNI